MSGEVVQCPRCGADVEMPTTETAETDMAIALVVTDPGTFSQHFRDEHPEQWASSCEARRKMNANPVMPGMPRKVDGTFLRPGEDVGDIAVRAGI